jgi:hypothetical protein
MNTRVITFGSERATVYPVTGPRFYVTCMLCGVYRMAGDGCGFYADPQGAAFKAYFCPECVSTRTVQS